MCGGRNDFDYLKVKRALDACPFVTCIISGGASGVDSSAIRWARENKKDCLIFKPLWDKYGKVAGPMRNKSMLVEGKPDLVYAFSGGKGTADMVAQARKANVEVIVDGN